MSSPIPTLTPEPTPTPTPLPHPAAFDPAFQRGLIRYENGQWLVSAYQTADRGREPVELVLLPDTFATNDELRAHNPLAPYTLRALDKNGQEAPLIWTGKEFRVAYQFPALFEEVGTENPKMIAENLDQIPFIPIEDIQSGLAAQSVLLAISEDGYKPFGEETVEAFKKLGGYSLMFEYHEEKSYRNEKNEKVIEALKLAYLKSWVNWTKSNEYPNDGQGINYENVTMKFSPYKIRTQLNGQVYDVPVFVLFNPKDPQNPSPDEFLVLFGIPTNPYIETSAFTYKNPSVPSRIWLYGEKEQVINPDDKDKKQTFPLPLDLQSPNLLESLLAQLLSIEGNDVSKLEYVPGYAHFPGAIIEAFQRLDSSNKVMETQPYQDPILFSLQQMLFLLEVGVAQ